MKIRAKGSKALNLAKSSRKRFDIVRRGSTAPAEALAKAGFFISRRYGQLLKEVGKCYRIQQSHRYQVARTTNVSQLGEFAVAIAIFLTSFNHI
jgi:hypothetical protein